MRLLVINSNTSALVTDRVAAATKRFASPDTELVFATGSFGAKVVATRTENAVAAHSTVDLVANHATDCDGVMIAVSYDSGLRAARELVGLPVMGITESSLLAALTLGTRIGIVTWGKGTIAVYMEMIDTYGLGSRICGSRRVDMPAPTDAPGEARLDEAMLKAAMELIDQHEAEVIVLVGAVLAGRSIDIESRLPVPVLDGIRCGIPMLEAMVRIGARAPAIGSYSLLGNRETAGLSPALRAQLAQAR